MENVSSRAKKLESAEPRSLAPLRVIEHRGVDGSILRIRIYERGVVVERSGETAAFISGVKVPDWLVEKAPEEIDPHELFRLKSPELISRFIRKLGLRRVMTELKGRVMDKRNRQRLIVFRDAGRARSYLMGGRYGEAFALEEVDPSITTLEAAWAWKKRLYESKRRTEQLWTGLHF